MHLYTQQDCNVYANGPYVVLHAAQDGSLEVDTGASVSVRDLLDDQIIGTGPKITLPFQKGETRVLAVER